MEAQHDTFINSNYVYTHIAAVVYRDKLVGTLMQTMFKDKDDRDVELVYIISKALNLHVRSARMCIVKRTTGSYSCFVIPYTFIN